METQQGNCAQLAFLDDNKWKKQIGRPQKTYIDQLIEDTGLQMEELKTLMAKSGNHSSTVFCQRDSTND